MDAGGEEAAAATKETNLLDRLKQDFQSKTSGWGSRDNKGLAGQSIAVASKASCDRAYWAIGHSQLYFALQNSLRYPTADAYVERLVRESDTKWVVPKVAVMTFTTLRGSSFFVAQELALLGVDLVLAGKSLKKMKRIQEKIQREGYVRKGKTPKIVLRKLKYDPQRLADVQEAAESIRQILGEHYDDQLAILVHGLATVQVRYRTTPDGVESNQANQFLYPHCLTQQLLSNLKASGSSTYRPRVVYVSSVGHCQGTDFNFERFVAHPEQGGAPQWTFESSTGDQLQEEEPKVPTPTTKMAESAKASLRNLQTSFQQSSLAASFRSPSSSDGTGSSKPSLFSGFFGVGKEEQAMGDGSGKNTSMLLSMRQRLSLEKKDNQRPEPRKSWSYVPPEAMLQSTEENGESDDDDEEEEEKEEKEEVKEEVKEDAKEEKEEVTNPEEETKEEAKEADIEVETESKMEPKDEATEEPKEEAEPPREEPTLVGMNVSVQQSTNCRDAQPPKERGKLASVADTEAFALVKMYYRSKMASLANAIALGREEPSLAVLSVYPGSVEANKPKKGLGMADAVYQTAFKAFQLSPSQAARSTLRAALDPDVNTHQTFQLQGTYLHCDGNPWTVADPTVLKNAGANETEGQQPYTLGEYVMLVRAAAKKVCDDMLPEA